MSVLKVLPCHIPRLSPTYFPSLAQVVQYAKTKSDVFAKADGSYAPKEKRKKQEEKGNYNCISYIWVYGP
jgi:hypothetical protein